MSSNGDKKINAAELFVKVLEKHGVEYVFGLPGDENLHFVEAIRNSSIKFILTRHEQAAGFMANAYGLLTCKVAVAMSTLGAGASNLTTAAAQAYLGAMPALYLTGQKAIRDNKQGGYQLIDVVDMMRPITKYTHSVVSGDTVAAVAHEAFHLALEERRGPVHIELPDDVALDDGNHPILPLNHASQPLASEASLAKAVDLLAHAKRPLVLIGGNANRPNIASALRTFIDKTQIPFFVTMLGKGVVDERSPCYIGTAAMPANDYVHCAINTSDLVINVGHDVMEKPPFIMMEGDGRTVVHLNNVAAQADIAYFPQHQVVGDMAASLQQLTERILPSGSWDFSNAHKAGEAMRRSVANKIDDTSSPVKPQYLAYTVREFMGEHDIVSVDNGIHKLWFSRNYPTYQPNTLLIDNALGSMGSGLPAAIACKLVHPDRKVMAVCGDGGFMMNSQELETAIRLNLDLIVVILNDNGLGMIRLKQMRDGHQPLGVDFSNPDFIKYAESFGARGHRIDDAKNLRNVLDAAAKDGGVHVIDVPIDYRENMHLFKEMMGIDCKKVLA